MEELYNQLYNDGKYTKTFEDFKVQFGTPEKSQKLYTALNESGDYTKSFEDFKTRFITPAKTQDSVSADPTAESKENNMGSKSEVGSSELQDASDFENTQEKNTWLEDYFGKNEFTDFFGDIYRSASSGWAAGETVDEAFDVFKGKEASDAEIMAFVEKSKELENKGQTDEMKALSQKMADLKKEGYNGVSAFMGAWWDNPSAMLQYSVMSLSQMASALKDSEEVLGTAAATSGAGALTGAGVGALAGGIGAAPGAVAGSIGGFFGGLSGSMEAGMTTAELIQEQAVKDGLNWGQLSNKERFDYIRKVQNDTEKFNDIKDRAIARGMTIGAIDGVVGALSGGVGSAARKSVATGTRSALAGAAEVGAVAALETGGGILSEVAGQAAAGQDFNLEEILIEGFADKTFTGVSLIKSVAQGGPKYTLNGQKLNGKQFSEALKIMDDESYVTADINVENSPAVEKLVNDRRQNIAADQNVDSRISDVEDRAKAIKLTKEQDKLRGNKEGNKIKLTQLQAELNAISKKYENSDVDATIEQRKQAVAQAVDNKFEAEFNKNYRALKEAEVDTGIEPIVFDNSKSFYETAAKDLNVTEEYLKENAPDGVFVGQGKVYIDKEQAKKSIDIATGNTGAISVASHEVLHPIFNALIGGVKEQGKFVNEFKSRMTSKQKTYVDNQLKARGYTKEASAIELMNIFSDGIIKNEINYDQTLFERLGDAIIKLFKGQGFDKLSFDNGKDVYNFLKEYNTSIKAGKLSDKAISTIKEAETKKGTTVKEAKLLSKEQFSLSVEQAENNLRAAEDADPNDPNYFDNLEKAELALEEAEAAAKSSKPIDTTTVAKQPASKLKTERPEKEIRTTDLSPRDPISKKIMDTYNEGMQGVERPERKANIPLPAALERKLIPLFEGYINTIVQQKFKQAGPEALEFQDALSILRAEVSNATRTFDPTKNKDLAGYVKKIVQTRQSLMFKDANKQFNADIESDVAKGVAATEDVQSIDRSGAVERGQATFDQLDLVDDALVSDIEKELARELKTRSAKGLLSEKVQLNLNGTISEISWIEDFVNKTLFKKILKKWGAIGESKGQIKIPGAYIDFLNDKKNFDIIMKALPVKTIKKSYSKLFNLEKIGRELTAEGNPIYRIAPIDKKTFLQYFLDGKKTTILERQKQLAREIITPVAKEAIANYATPENLSALKEMQELAPDASLDAQAEIIIEAQLEQMQSQLDRYKSEKSGFDVIQFSKTVTPEQKQNIKNVLEPLQMQDSNVNFNSSIIDDILIGLDKVKTFKDLAYLIWNSGEKTLGIKALREYRAEVLKLLANRLNYSDTVRLLVSAVTSHNKIFKSQQKIIGYAYGISKLQFDFKKANTNIAKADVVENFLKYVSRSIRTLGIDEMTTNKAIYDNIITPLLGDPVKYGFSLFQDKNTNRTYINRNGIRLFGLTDVTNIKSDFSKYAGTINKEATEVTEWLMKEAETAIENKDIDSFIGFLALLSADQRGPIRKMSSAGFAFKDLSVKDAVLEHETEAVDIFNAWKKFVQGKMTKTKLLKFLKEAKVNLVSKEFDKILKLVRKEILPTNPKNIGKARYESTSAKKYINNLKNQKKIQGFNSKNNFILQPSKSINKDFNNIIENATGIESGKAISEAKSKMLDKNKGGWKFFVPPSADDFAGLMYGLFGKGEVGDKNAKWFKENLFDPFAEGINNFEAYKQQTAQAFKSIKNSIKSVPKGLGKINETGFTNDVAIRTYLWEKNGHEIPGLDENDIKDLVEIVENNNDFKEFALQVERLLEGYQAPEKNWLAGTITTDVINTVNTSKREEFLQQWQANSDEVFTKDNINKLRVAFGEDYVQALEDMLYRMKTGRNRPSGSNKLTNQFMNWVNDSVGTIMFFNTRSALLQTLSITNFINWEDNNPIKAAKAFANQKQFWADFSMIFNSDFLKQRRSGLKTDINADDIASAAESSSNKAKAALSAILKMGFLPTQIADSFAIAMGGASFLRNRIESYTKQGLSKEDAEAKAFLDFQEVAEETQQSSRPDRISQQQASPLGRIILAFANTPMQYMRLTKKAILDIKNRRGDLKTNISKIVYYTAIQNIIFSSLQAAMFAALFEDDEEDIEEKEGRVVNSMLDTLLRGMGIAGAVVSTVKNVGLEIDKQSKKPRPDYAQAAIRTIDLSPPLSSKLRKLMSAGRAFSYKNVRDKMKGFSLENPAFYAGGQVVSALTNVPLDRAVKKADNIRLAMDNDTKLWQKIALALGYSSWDVGLVEKEPPKTKGKRSFGKPTTWKNIRWKREN